MGNAELALMAHLMRRAGFGATRDELDTCVAQGYEATVEQLLHPERAPVMDEDILRRYHVDQNSLMLIESSQAYWLYRIINTQRPLEEKMALFWHSLFATAYGKLNHAKAVVNQTNTFRRYGLGDFRTLLLELSRDPAMIFWLDNKDNHKDAPNENYGRELLELFSMGIGNYTEDDVKACARAFTGWTIANADYMSIRASRDSIWPHGRLDWQFEYNPDDHDDSDKTFLGHTGPFNGEEVIDIICRQPATAWFVASKLYAFFVSDSPNEGSIQFLADRFAESDGDIREVVRALFLADFFRGDEARMAKVKSPDGVSSRHGAAGWQLQLPGVGHRQPGHGHQFHGPGNPQSPDSGGLAYRPGVDRYREPGGKSECLSPGNGRPGPTRGAGRPATGQVPGRNPVTRSLC